MSKKLKNYTFTLKNLDFVDIRSRYNLSVDPEKGEPREFPTQNVTRISELADDMEMTFLGSSKQVHKCNISMIDFKSSVNINMLRYHCYWCRNPFNTLPIGCPIKYKPRIISSKYTSVATGNDYQIDESVSSSQNLNGNNVVSEPYYQTDGVFCSFNCCKAFADDNVLKPFYLNSNMLLIRLYNETFNVNTSSITPAPHWRTINHYGGFMSITEFRDSFDKIEYHDHGIVRELSLKMNSSGSLYEKKLRF
jgi:hypothetical protein